jgi:chromosome segregation ATPase
MKKITLLILSSILFVGAATCSDIAKTSADAPNSTKKTGESPTAETTQSGQNDATSKVRRDQLNSDIRANEQRNDATNGDINRADGDLSSEVRSKLEANIPNGNLTVDAKDGAVVVSGTVPTQEQLDKIEPLAKEIKGVMNVNVAAKVAPVPSTSP